MIAAGELRHRVELQEKVEGPGRDEYGKPIYTWTTRGHCWCKIEQLTANEQLIAQQQNPQATHKVTTRYMTSLKPTPAWALLHNGRRLFIAAINNVNELNEEWQFICGELTNG